MRLFGHPLHPMLVHFPVAFWTLTTIAYIATALGFVGPTHAIATAANAVALIMTLPAAIAGLMEWRLIGEGTPALSIATLHMTIMLSTWTMFVAALVLSMIPSLGAEVRNAVAALCAIIGFGLLSAGGWLGARLVYEFGVGRATTSG